MEDDLHSRFLTVAQRQRRIGRELERLWSDIVAERVPDEILELLKQLDERGQDTDS